MMEEMYKKRRDLQESFVSTVGWAFDNKHQVSKPPWNPTLRKRGLEEEEEEEELQQQTWLHLLPVHSFQPQRKARLFHSPCLSSSPDMHQDHQRRPLLLFEAASFDAYTSRTRPESAQPTNVKF